MDKELFKGLRDWREIPMWKDVTEEEFMDWHWQLRNRIRTLEELEQVINLTPEEREAIEKGLGKILRMAITPYYALLMDPDDPNDPIRRQAVPTSYEFHKTVYDMEDPLAEDVDMPVPFLVHRYPDRVLFLVTDMCNMYCRHCTRSRMVGNELPIHKDALQEAIDYIKEHKEIRDVLISGGDPLTMGEERLEEIIAKVREIPHVEIIRIGSRAPVTNPLRITEKLVNMLKKYHPLYLNTHFNHPKEVTPLAARAANMLADAGIPLGNQTVLLKGINDCPFVMKKLVHELLKIRVRPYYIYQCDLTSGLEHFRTSVWRGIEIIEFLRGHTSGLAVPTFVVDAPGGGGKIPLMPNYLVSMSDKKVILRNYEGKLFMYPEPEVPSAHDPEKCPYCRAAKERGELDGVAKLLDDGSTEFVLSGPTLRDQRRVKYGKVKPTPCW